MPERHSKRQKCFYYGVVGALSFMDIRELNPGLEYTSLWLLLGFSLESLHLGHPLHPHLHQDPLFLLVLQLVQLVQIHLVQVLLCKGQAVFYSTT